MDRDPAAPAPPWHRRTRRLLRKRWVAYPLLFLLLGTAMRISGFAEGKFYYPDRVDYGTPADDGLAYEPVTFKSLDGTRLTGWFLPARGRPKGTVVHAHGNAANISNHATLAAFLPKASYHVLVFDYRGYGESEGSPGRRGCLDDVRAAVDYARSRKEVDGDRIALFGQSLGGALSIVAAAERPGSVRAVVAEAAFTSHRAIARDVMQRNPITWLFAWPLAALALSCDYAPIDAVDQIAPTPLLVVHGTADEVIPYWMGEALYARAKEPKRFYAVPGGRHLQISEGPRKAYHNAVLAFLDETVGGATAEPGKAAEGPR